MERELRNNLFQIYLREMMIVFLNQQMRPIVLRHVELVQELDRKFRLSSARDDRARRELELLHHQMKITFETIRSWSLSDAEIASQLNGLVQRREYITQRYAEMEIDIKRLSCRTSDFLRQARTIHDESMRLLKKTFDHCVNTTHLFQETEKKLRTTKPKESSWLQNIAMAIGVIIVGYAISLVPLSSVSPVFASSGLSLTPSGVTVDTKFRLPTQAPTQSISRPLVASTSTSIVDSATAHIQRHAVIPNIIPFPSISISHTIPIGSTSIPTKPACSLMGYWKAVVEGFNKENHITQLAFEMGEELIGNMESRASDLAGMVGAWGTARGYNIYQSMRKFHNDCQ